MSFKVENMEEKNMVKLVIEATAEEFEAGLQKRQGSKKDGRKALRNRNLLRRCS